MQDKVVAQDSARNLSLRPSECTRSVGSSASTGQEEKFHCEHRFCLFLFLTGGPGSCGMHSL